VPSPPAPASAQPRCTSTSPTRRSFAAEVKRRCFAAFGAALDAAEAEHPGDPRAAVCARGIAYLRFARDHPGQYAILFHTYVPKKGAAPADPEEVGLGMETFEAHVAAVARALPGNDRVFEPLDILWMALHRARRRPLRDAAVPVPRRGDLRVAARRAGPRTR